MKTKITIILAVLLFSGAAIAAVDLLAAPLANTHIVAAGAEVTYPQLAALWRKAALDRANAGGIQ